MVSVEIVFETHSLTTDNERGVATGWLEGHLSADGRRLARGLGERRRGDNVTAVFCSDLGRAVETTEIAFGGSAIPIHLDRRLREINYGALNGMSAAQLQSERSRHLAEPFPGGESYLQVVDRVQSFLTDLSRHWDGSRVVVIGHSATRWALDHLLCGAALEDLLDAPFAWREGWRYLLPTG